MKKYNLVLALLVATNLVFVADSHMMNFDNLSPINSGRATPTGIDVDDSRAFHQHVGEVHYLDDSSFVESNFLLSVKEQIEALGVGSLTPDLIESHASYIDVFCNACLEISSSSHGSVSVQKLNQLAEHPDLARELLAFVPDFAHKEQLVEYFVEDNLPPLELDLVSEHLPAIQKIILDFFAANIDALS